MIQEGDIVEIPLPDERVAIGWILHVSTHFKNAVGFIVFGIKGELREDAVSQLSGEPKSVSVLGPLYTHKNAISHYGWTVTSHQMVSEEKKTLTKREVGGGVYIGDEYIGSVDEIGDPNVRPMLAMGMPVVYSEISKAFPVANTPA